MGGRSSDILGRRGAIGVALVLLGSALGGCSIPLADLPVVGLPAGAPARPADADAAVYPAVHDMPAARSEPTLDPADQSKVESDLIHARERQAVAVGRSAKPSDKPADQ
jgi:hypothetical protein